MYLGQNPAIEVLFHHLSWFLCQGEIKHSNPLKDRARQWLRLRATVAAFIIIIIIIIIIIKNLIKSVAYSSQGCHTGQLDFCNWLADGSTTG